MLVEPTRSQNITVKYRRSPFGSTTLEIDSGGAGGRVDTDCCRSAILGGADVSEPSAVSFCLQLGDCVANAQAMARARHADVL